MALFGLEAALFAVLRADATLTTLAPGGVHQDVAPADTSGVFVVLRLEASEDELEMNGATAWWDRIYAIEAWNKVLDSSGPEAAAERVDAIMMAKPSLTGYTTIDVTRVDVISHKVLDQAGTWQQRGAQYRVKAAPSA